jgi:hypothetical protein
MKKMRDILVGPNPTYKKPEVVKVGRRKVGEVWYDDKKKWWGGYHYNTDHSFSGASTKQDAIDFVIENDEMDRQ